MLATVATTYLWFCVEMMSIISSLMLPVVDSSGTMRNGCSVDCRHIKGVRVLKIHAEAGRVGLNEGRAVNCKIGANNWC
ncbi:hypothetical protein FPOAC1_001155 [Fusarium poae]|uniref:hypothetical protein n=1 Tax=Fusarium poae TaxID=36050 RepID=UPI001CEB521B|nr:hypothetical protein FPOAC1_001155 [Fusarium poae]KAG8675178.1 hypothetical protein FPOAC1_001155 [Fusarium poae]